MRPALCSVEQEPLHKARGLNTWHTASEQNDEAMHLWDSNETFGASGTCLMVSAAVPVWTSCFYLHVALKESRVTSGVDAA